MHTRYQLSIEYDSMGGTFGWKQRHGYINEPKIGVSFISGPCHFILQWVLHSSRKLDHHFLIRVDRPDVYCTFSCVTIDMVLKARLYISIITIGHTQTHPPRLVKKENAYPSDDLCICLFLFSLLQKKKKQTSSQTLLGGSRISFLSWKEKKSHRLGAKIRSFFAFCCSGNLFSYF